SRDARPVQADPAAAKAQLMALKGKAIGIGSPRASLEANFALRELVGADNFYSGVSDAEFGLLNQVLDIYQNRPVNIANVRDIERADAVLILGEDLTNTAARLALAVRQAAKNLGKEMAAKLKFPNWHDAAIRQLAMDNKSPIHILSSHATRLDDIAKRVHLGSAQDSARIGFAVAHALDANAPAVSDLRREEQALVKSIAADLKGAKQPLIISGTSSLEPALLNAAANIATALSEGDKRASLALVVPEANSLGLALLMQGSNNTLGQALQSGGKNAIVLENDLYRRAPSAAVDSFLNNLEQLTVLDGMQNKTGEAAHLVLPAATFAESSGTFVNYESRAQYFFSVFKPAAPILASCKWLSAPGAKTLDITAALAAVLPQGSALNKLTPGADYNFAGLRAPRQHHRYSGRTAMRANISVHEPKQEQDEDGIMVYSMEGVPPLKDAAVFSSPWAPGWNSNQSLFKFETAVGGPLKEASHGERLIPANGADKAWYPSEITPPAGDGYRVVPLYHLFGSEELTAHSEAIQAKATSAYIALNPATARQLELTSGDGVQVQYNGSVPVLLRDSIPFGNVGVSVGLRGLNFQNLAATVTLHKASEWRAPKDWRASNIIVSDKRDI
ncbi:MAG: molybdopterin-dependent oxidoreductase, partial [Pseudomonadales bacterium]|nr:molybdopterin-dependent oxidoreductase [Pseudomonadales bacterium]